MNLSKKLFFSCVCAWASGGWCAAQDAPSTAAVGEYFFIGIELPMFRVKDRANSPQAFEGYGYKINVGYEHIKQRFISRFQVGFLTGSASPRTKPSGKPLTKLEASHIEFTYSYYRNVKNIPDAESLNFVQKGTYAGGSVSFLADVRQYSLPSNNVLGFQSNVTFNAGVLLRENLNHQWRFNYEATTPLLALTLRPSYVGMPLLRDTFEVSPKTFLKGIKITTLPKFVGFKNTFSFDQQIKDHRARRLSYDWFVLANRSAQKPVYWSGGGFGYQSLFKM